MPLMTRRSFQMQVEREKQNYDFDNLQSQLDKALGQSTRMQKERETIQLEVDRLQDKYEKAQVSAVSPCVAATFRQTQFAPVSNDSACHSRL